MRNDLLCLFADRLFPSVNIVFLPPKENEHCASGPAGQPGLVSVCLYFVRLFLYVEEAK